MAKIKILPNRYVCRTAFELERRGYRVDLRTGRVSPALLPPEAPPAPKRIHLRPSSIGLCPRYVPGSGDDHPPAA